MLASRFFTSTRAYNGCLYNCCHFFLKSERISTRWFLMDGKGFQSPFEASCHLLLSPASICSLFFMHDCWGIPLSIEERKRLQISMSSLSDTLHRWSSRFASQGVKISINSCFHILFWQLHSFSRYVDFSSKLLCLKYFWLLGRSSLPWPYLWLSPDGSIWHILDYTVEDHSSHVSRLYLTDNLLTTSCQGVKPKLLGFYLLFSPLFNLQSFSSEDRCGISLLAEMGRGCSLKWL